MSELYRKLHGSEAGLGDLILKTYDSTSAQLAARRAELRQFDPNAQLKEPIQFTLSSLDGDKLQLSSLLGKVIVLDFWATWCAPCRAQHPLYEEVKAQFKDSGDVVFLSVDTDEDHSLVKPFLTQIKWNQKVYFEDGLQSLLQVSTIPTTIIFDKKGEIFNRMIGYLPDRFVDMLTDRVSAALGKPLGRSGASNQPPSDQSMTPPFPRVIWIVLDSVGIGEMPDAAAYGDAGSDTLGNIAPRPATAPAESRATWTWAISSRCRAFGPRRAAGGVRPLRARLARQRHHHRPLGNGRHPSRQAVPALSARLPARNHAGVRTPHRPRHARQQGRVGDRDHQGTRARSTCAPARPSSTRRPTACFRWPRTKK